MTKPLSQLEQDILEGLEQFFEHGEGERISGEEAVRRRRGRPPLPAVKVAVKIRLDSDLLGVLKRSGTGWQTRINATLRREFMQPKSMTLNIPIVVPPSVRISQPVRLDRPMPSAIPTSFTSTSMAFETLHA
jgi:uncharacterized protein (DUF4415 family)